LGVSSICCWLKGVDWIRSSLSRPHPLLPAARHTKTESLRDSETQRLRGREGEGEREREGSEGQRGRGRVKEGRRMAYASNVGDFHKGDGMQDQANSAESERQMLEAVCTERGDVLVESTSFLANIHKLLQGLAQAFIPA
jgi:hypothetical protein